MHAADNHVDCVLGERLCLIVPVEAPDAALHICLLVRGVPPSKARPWHDFSLPSSTTPRFRSEPVAPQQVVARPVRKVRAEGCA